MQIIREVERIFCPQDARNLPGLLEALGLGGMLGCGYAAFVSRLFRGSAFEEVAGYE